MKKDENATVFLVREKSSNIPRKKALLSEVNEGSPFVNHTIALEENTEKSPLAHASLFLESTNSLPHQHEVKNYFSYKQLSPSNQRKFPFLKILRIGKGNFLEIPKLPKNAIAALALGILGTIAWWQGGNFLADSTVKNTPAPIAFDGAVYPFAKSPNWFSTGGKNNKKYTEYKENELVVAPKYDITTIQNDDWEKDVVNTRITYPIVYMGKYIFDYKENTGSHPAVDIKLPVGTPVYSIANGIVVKSEDLTSGFGKHIVVRHDGVPDYGTIYSSYSHLSERNVKSGDTVVMGEQIGKVGDSGNATTAHIHFQIDLPTAAFHPYWPFTTAEAKSAKVDFFGAVNIGLGKEKAKEYTIHPFDFIHAHVKGSRIPNGALKNAASEKTKQPSASTAIITKKPEPTLTVTPKVIPKNDIKTTDIATPIPTEISSLKEIFTDITLQVSPSRVLKGDDVYVTIYAKNQKQKWCTSCVGSGNIVIAGKNNEEKRNFTLGSGMHEAKFIANSAGIISVRVEINGKTITKTIEVLENNTIAPTSAPIKNVITTTGFSKSDLFSDISAKHPNATAIAYLKKKNVIGGYADGTFRPNKTVNRIEALKMIFGGLNVGTNRSVSNPFADIENGKWFTPYVLTAYDLDLVSGYSDGSFRPEKTMNRAEFFKIVAKTVHADTATLPEKNPFQDVERTTWVAPYAEWAKRKKLLDFGLEFQPNAPMTRAEIAEALYRIKNNR